MITSISDSDTTIMGDSSELLKSIPLEHIITFCVKNVRRKEMMIAYTGTGHKKEKANDGYEPVYLLDDADESYKKFSNIMRLSKYLKCPYISVLSAFKRGNKLYKRYNIVSEKEYVELNLEDL